MATFNDKTRTNIRNYIEKRTDEHGNDSGVEYQVGDLLCVIDACLAQMSPKQLEALLNSDLFQESCINFDKEESLETCLGEHSYEVHVRAIVTGENEELDNKEFASEWEVYDHSNKGDTETTVRLDTLVKVRADSREEAVEKAKEQAPDLRLEYMEDDIEIWVDTDQEDSVIRLNK